MVFTQAATTAFFTSVDGMGIPAATYARMATEGIVTVDDLEELDEETLKQIADNLRSSRYVQNKPFRTIANEFYSIHRVC